MITCKKNILFCKGYKYMYLITLQNELADQSNIYTQKK